MARVLISDADGHRSRWEMVPNSYVWQRFSRLERVTGIEPALSAWELLELVLITWVRCGFHGHERPGLSLGCPP